MGQRAREVRRRAWRWAAAVVFAVWGGGTVPVWAASSTNLLSVYQLAVDNDATYQAARYALKAALQDVPQARAELLPRLDATGNYSDTIGDASFTGIPLDRRNVKGWTWNVQLVQPLVRLSKWFAYRQARATTEEAREKFQEAKQALILQVAKAYFAVLVAQADRQAAHMQVQAMDAQLKQAQHGFRSGLQSVTDVYEAQAKMARARAQLAAAHTAIQTADAGLERITGEAPGRLNGLNDVVIIPSPQPATIGPWVNRAASDSPAVRAQEAALRASQSDVQSKWAENLPTLDVTASYGKNYSSGSLINPTNFSTRSRSSIVELRLKVPLFAGGAMDSQVAQARATEHKARAQLEAARRKAALQAKQAYLAIESGVAQIKALETAVKAGKESVKGNRIGYKLGLRINSDVLRSQQQLYSARRDLVKARYKALLDVLRLKAAAGELRVWDLAHINAMLGG